MGRPRNADRVPPRYPNLTKRCPVCELTLPWSAFYPRVRHPDGAVAGVRSKCKLCESTEAQERWQRIAAGDHSDMLAKRRVYHAQRMASDPEYAARVRETARENARLRYQHDEEYREQQKAKARARNRDPRSRAREREQRRRARQERKRETSRRLPSEPWRTWLRSQQWRFETTTEFATWLGVDESGLTRWLDGTNGILLDTADAVLCRIGEPQLLMELWPELYDFNEERAA